MNLIIVRHGESEAALKGIVEGRADFRLTERGRRQAGLLGEWITARWQVTRIYTSPLLRARETAEAIAQAAGIGMTEDPDLMEFNNGLLAGITMSEVEHRYPAVADVPAHRSVYRQETRIQYRMRAENVLSRVFHENGEHDQVVLVSHGGMINQLFRAFMKLPLDQNAFIASDDAGLHFWAAPQGSRGIILTNSLDHLKGR